MPCCCMSQAQLGQSSKEKKQRNATGNASPCNGRCPFKDTLLENVRCGIPTIMQSANILKYHAMLRDADHASYLRFCKVR